MSDAVLPKPLRVAGTVFAWVLGAILLASIAATVWIGLRGLAAYTHLSAAEATAAKAVDNLSDPTQAAALIADLSQDTAAARELTSDPIWGAAEHLAWIGPQLHAVSTVAAAADDVASDALTPLAEVASTFTLDSFRPTDGKIDTAMFETIAEPARTGADGVATAAASVTALDDTAMLPPVRAAIDDVSNMLDSGATATDALARASALLPSMLGADGERDYLVVFQNNAEWRSLGGIVGSMALIHTDDGSMKLVDQDVASAFPKYEDSVVPLDADVERIYGTRPGQWFQNVTQVPDFSVSGELSREMWSRKHGLEVDGVISMDPVALSYLLNATGPIELPTGDVLTSENAVQLLLNDVYVRYEDPTAQDAFFAAAAASVFEALSNGTADPAALVGALGRAGDESRLLLWSAVADDQVVLAGTTLAGGLPATDHDTARFGVYLNDGTGSKMDYYVTAEPTIGWESCTLDGHGRTVDPVTLTITLTNTAPADAATSLPEYITGGGSFGVPAGTARTVAYVYLPEEYVLLDAEITNDAGFGGGYHGDLQVMSFGADLKPGETVTATFSARPPEAGAATAIAEMTPTIDADLPTEFATECVPG